MIKIRFLEYKDYDIYLSKWWKQWRWSIPPRDFLPQDGVGGIMVECDEVPIVAGFIYFTNSKVAWSEYIISNFDFKDREKRKEAIDIIIEELCNIAKEKGSKYMFTTVKNESLIESYKNNGFILGSNNTSEMVKLI